MCHPGERPVTTWVVGIAAALMAFVVAVVCAALVEVFRQLADLRRAVNLDDAPRPLALRAGEVHVLDVGLPAALAKEPAAAVIFLSQKCATCLAVAEVFRGGAPASVWFVLPSPPMPTTLLAMLRESAERVIVDDGDAIANRLGLNVTPSVLTIAFGEITRAEAVSTPRQALSLVPKVVPTHPPLSVLPQQPHPSGQQA